MKHVSGKVVLLGASGVGKTSIITRYVNNIHPNHSQETIGASFFTCNITLNDAVVKLHVWDTAGQERFKSMTPMYYRNANVAFLVFDLTDYSSFLSIKSWVTELRRNVDYAMLLVIIGNKSDLHNEKQINSDEAEDYAKSICAFYHETSALLDSNIDKLFAMTAKNLVILESNDCHQISNLRSNCQLVDSDLHSQEGILLPSSEEGPLNASIADGIKERSYCC